MLIATDQWINAFCMGSPDETISSRLGRNHKGELIQVIVDKLFFWDPFHCETSIEPEDREDDAIIK